MNIINLENISKVFTQRKVFDHTSFYLEEGEKVGVVGINGTGKSTLLKVMAGLEEVDEGTVTLANHIIVRYLPQIPVFTPGQTVIEAVMEHLGKGEDVWNAQSDAKSMLTKVGVTDFEENVDHLSGGQRKRLALIAALVSDADVLLLDEPTNHLDQEMADWLENYLKRMKKTLVMVTHDRYFLDSVCNRIVEVDKGIIYSYDSNYSGFLELKEQREESIRSTDKKRANILRKEQEWIRRGAQARSTKQKARIARYEEMKSQENFKGDDAVELSSITTRLGRTTVELNHICKSYENRMLINDFSYIFLKNDRIGFLGNNGCGKTTLMKMIVGLERPDSGDITIGQTVKIAYYSQEISDEDDGSLSYMDPSQRVIDYIKDTAEYVMTTDGRVSASQMLERFLFPADQQYSPIEKLSGGERRRLNLLRVLMESPNVLVLDEPTNDLDITTLRILEDYLDDFLGIVIIVSHDRYFLDRTVRRIFAFEENGTLKQYEGGYSDYAFRRKMEGLPTENEKNTGKTTDVGTQKKDKGSWKKPSTKLKFTYNEQREYETIESDIASLEEQVAAFEKEMLTCTSDFVKLNELTNKKNEVEEQLLEKMERWEYLEDLAEKIAAQNAK